MALKQMAVKLIRELLYYYQAFHRGGYIIQLTIQNDLLKFFMLES